MPFNLVILKPYGLSTRESQYFRKNQTLYSFRHSGAINVFKRTNSLHNCNLY